MKLIYKEPPMYNVLVDALLAARKDNKVVSRIQLAQSEFNKLKEELGDKLQYHSDSGENCFEGIPISIVPDLFITRDEKRKFYQLGGPSTFGDRYEGLLDTVYR